jgi:hypothetical protein
MRKNTRPRKRPHDERPLWYLRRLGLLPHGMHACDVRHDVWCRQWEGRACHGDPAMPLCWSRPMTGRH